MRRRRHDMLRVISKNRYERWCAKRQLDIASAAFQLETCYYGLRLRTRPGALFVFSGVITHYSYGWLDTLWALGEASVRVDIALADIAAISRAPLAPQWRKMFIGADDVFVIKMLDGTEHFMVLQRGADDFERAVAAQTGPGVFRLGRQDDVKTVENDPGPHNPFAPPKSRVADLSDAGRGRQPKSLTLAAVALFLLHLAILGLSFGLYLELVDAGALPVVWLLSALVADAALFLGLVLLIFGRYVKSVFLAAAAGLLLTCGPLLKVQAGGNFILLVLLTYGFGAAAVFLGWLAAWRGERQPPEVK